MDNNKVVIEGILSKGYGVSPKLVMRDKRLTIESKAIYAYISSFAGNGSSSFPGIEKMCKELGTSEKRFRKHRDLLVEFGYIEIQKRKGKGGKFDSNLYVIKQMIEITEESTVRSNRHDGETPSRQNDMTNNNSSLNNNSINNNNSDIKHIVVAKAPTVASKNVMPVEMMEMIIDYLNNKFEKKKNYRLSDTYKKLFNALYKAGHRDIGEYQYVIDNKYSEWIGTDMQTYIRPATLFAKEKFEKYIDEELFVAYSNNKHQQQLKPWEVSAYEPTTSWNDNVNDRGSISKPVPHKQLGINF